MSDEKLRIYNQINVSGEVLCFLDNFISDYFMQLFLFGLWFAFAGRANSVFGWDRAEQSGHGDPAKY